MFHASTATADATPGAAIPLSALEAGSEGSLYASQLAPDETELIRAIGLYESVAFRVLKQGEPCILQVQGTRIGLTAPLAAQLRVLLHNSP